MSKIVFSPGEDKIHIFVPPCNVLYLGCDETFLRACIYKLKISWTLLNSLLFIVLSSYDKTFFLLYVYFIASRQAT